MLHMHKTRVEIVLWVLLVGAVFGTGLYYIPREYPALTFWEDFYSTLRMFVLERDLPWFPRTWQLIAIHFIAPLVTLSAIGKILSYLFGASLGLTAGWHSDHVIVCGIGRTGRIIASTLRSRGVTVVGIDRGPRDAHQEWASQHRVRMLFGDFHSQKLLVKAGARRARSVLFVSGDDVANVEGAFNAYDLMKASAGPVRLIWAHIADDRLAETARAAVSTQGTVGIRFFDTYHVAAESIVRQTNGAGIEGPFGRINIIGFGKFGSDLLEVLVKSRSCAGDCAIRVIDRHDRSAEVERLSRHLGVADRVRFLRSDIKDLEPESDGPVLNYICTDDDLGNLSMAPLLSNKFAKS